MSITFRGSRKLTKIIGLDAATFLRFLRMLRNIFTITSIIVVALLVIDIVYNLKYVNSSDRNALSLLTIQNVSGNWMWPALAASYVISEFSALQEKSIR